jgi:hypothetical protein
MATRKPAAPQVQAPAPAREPVREPLRPVIPGRAVALNRAGQPVQRAGSSSGVNQFDHPPPPEGWSWEWKAEFVLKQPNTAHMAEMRRVGWEPVLYENHPGIFAPEFDPDTGERTKGPVRRLDMMLMERPIVLTLEAMQDEKNKADNRVHVSRQQYRAGPDTKGSQTAVYDDTARGIAVTRTHMEPVVMPGQRQPVD